MAIVRGTDGPDVIDGTSGDDQLFGRGGNDNMEGRGGDDLVSGGGGHDFVAGDNGNDRVVGGGGDDLMFGSAGNDVLNGGDGNDNVNGGQGNRDQLQGGAGADRFTFTSKVDSGVGPGNRDRIIDFDGDEGDVLDVHLMDADTTTGINDEFTFIGTDTPGKGEIGFVVGGNTTIVRANTDDDAAMEFELQLNGSGHNLGSGDFDL
jgi:Ca2+-binding RTX toxin-like protein